MNKTTLKPLNTLPERIWFNGLHSETDPQKTGELTISFWVGDNEANLFLFLDLEEYREAEDYGICEELLEYMRVEGLESIENSYTDNGDLEVFHITQDIINEFYND